MSKVLVSMPKGMIRNSAVGALLALICYVLLQFPVAFLIHREILGEGVIYPAVCVCAGAASLVGCGYSVMRGGAGSVLSASAVVLVFLAVTAAVAVLAGESGEIGEGFTGVGVAMAAGGLAASLLPISRGEKGRSRASGKKGRRDRR